jgi:hypothetical protein
MSKLGFKPLAVNDSPLDFISQMGLNPMFAVDNLYTCITKTPIAIDVHVFGKK